MLFDEKDEASNLSVYGRLAKVEEKAGQNSRRLLILEEQNMSFHKLAASFELMQRLEEDRQKRQYLVDEQQRLQQEKFSNTLEKMNESMQQLYSSNKDNSSKIDNVEVVVSGVKAKVDEMEQDDNINWKKALKNLGSKVFIAIAGAIGAYIAYKLGIIPK